MSDWLSSLWEPNWRSFTFFNLYRLLLALAASLALVFPHPWVDPLHLLRAGTPLWLVGIYLALLLVGVLVGLFWQRHFNRQLTLQVLADVLCLGAFMYHAGGVSSGLGVLMLVSLTAASLVGRGRLVLLYAALATLFVLGQQILGIFVNEVDPATIVNAGVLSAGFFATAILARLLGQRIMYHEELARRHGIELDNQQRINQRMLECMQDGVLVVGAGGQVLRHNPAAASLLGLDPEAAPPLVTTNPGLATAWQAWRSAGGTEMLELPGVEGVMVRVRFEPTPSSAGESLIFIEDLARVQAQAQQLKLAALGRLTGSIAHEIRNPLASISHAAELLGEENRNDLRQRLLRILGDNVGRLDRIVQDVLELGRRDRSRPERVALDAFLLQFIEEFCTAEGVSPALIERGGQVGLSLWFDRVQLRQVLWNLVANARRHARGQASSIRLLGLARGGQQVELHVIDDGPGIPESVRAQIFEPFFTTEAKGTGLGLFIARELCEANGAHLELGERTDQGHFVISGRSSQ